MKFMSAALALFAALLLAPGAQAACDGEQVDAGDRHLWMRVAGDGVLSVVFESGNGDDSSVWAGIEPAIRTLGVRTVVYDRAGLGQSALASAPYAIDGEVAALERALFVCGVDGPIIVVAHSYGGFIATLLASRNERVAGVVMVDANVPHYFDDAVTAAIVAAYEPQFPALQQAAPRLAQVLVPIILAYPETARRVRVVGLQRDIPVIDIVAERSWGSTPEQNAAMRQAHADFVAQSRRREAVFAADSGHNVMRDQPQTVIDAIARMIERVRGPL